MKRILAGIILSLLLTGNFIPVPAQSDYQTVNNFKTKYSEIEKEINSAATLEELNSILTKIEQFKLDYADQKELLDKSLYPDDFDKSFEKLNGKYLLRQGDFTTIDVLKTEVAELEGQVEFLNRRNNELIEKIAGLKAESKKDKRKLAEYENLLAELRSSLRKRDRLVISMVDSLMPPIMREKATLTTEEKYKIYSDAERENVIDNVKISIVDNIKFLLATSLNPNDLTEVKKQQDKFADTWKIIGPKLVDVYADKESKTKELMEIDSLFVLWYNTTEQEAWNSINEEFAVNGINLKSFSDEDEFTNAVTGFISDEIKSINVKGEQMLSETYSAFADSTWYKSVKPEWIPYLEENKMISAANKDKIENRIADWKSELYPSKLWLYIIIWFVAVIIILPLILLIIKRRRAVKEN